MSGPSGTMGRRVLAVAGVSLLAGALIGLVAGRGPGVAGGMLLLMLGLVAVVLRRNHKDLEELEHGGEPSPLDRALAEDEEPRPPA